MKRLKYCPQSTRLLGINTAKIYLVNDTKYTYNKDELELLLNDFFDYFFKICYRGVGKGEWKYRKPNMPFREFEYCAKLLDKWVEGHDLDIYSSKLVKLPTPKCYVFYNGTEKHGDKEILKLSDAFMTKAEGCEWTVTMLNINKGHNLELMDRCRILQEYSEFVAMVRERVQSMKIS